MQKQKTVFGYLCPKLILGLTKGQVFAMQSNGPLSASLNQYQYPTSASISHHI